MWTLVKIEWIKTFRRWRTYIGFATIGFFLPLFFIAMKLSGGEFVLNSPALKAIQENFIVIGHVFNGMFVSRMLMNTLFVHIPLLVVLVPGDSVAGESASGTIRTILTRPPSRLEIIISKIILSLVYTALLLIFMALLSLIVGYFLFGLGDLVVLKDGILIFTLREALLRFALAYALAIVAMSVIASLAFLFSVLVSNAIGPIIGSIVVLIIFLIITASPIPAFETVRPYLFTTYTDVWEKAFADPIPWAAIGKYAGVLALYSIGFFGLSALIFQRKDILS
ncbi:MAG: ABC transporter permease subunit [Calditrichaeota bacterium]|nr:ABC transporter permease subunit [Calditrichota bacterium]